MILTDLFVTLLAVFFIALLVATIFRTLPILNDVGVRHLGGAVLEGGGEAFSFLVTERSGRLVILSLTAAVCAGFAFFSGFLSPGDVMFDFFSRSMVLETTDPRQVSWVGAFIIALIALIVYAKMSAPKSMISSSNGHH